jgi:hypothetical protein
VSDPTCGARFTNSSSSESGDGRGLVAIEELVGCMEVLICVLLRDSFIHRDGGPVSDKLIEV